MVDPYLFEQAEDSVDILSCGYEYCDFLTSGFGTIVTNREHLNQIQRFEKIANAADGPAAGESQGAWAKRCAQELSPEEQEYLYKLLLADHPPPEVHVIDGAILSTVGAGRFAAIFYYCTELMRAGLTADFATVEVCRYCNLFGITNVAPAVLDEMFWRRRAGKRIINEIIQDVEF